MGPTDSTLTVPASVPQPYVHVDNRAMIVHDGRSCVLFSSASFRWLAETVRLLAAERRATRQQGAQVFGGFMREDGSATLYAGTGQNVVTCDVSAEGVQELSAKLAR